MSEEHKKELTDKELDNVAGAGRVEVLLDLIYSSPSTEMYMLEQFKKGKKPALVTAIIEFCNKTNPSLAFIANDVVGLLKYRWVVEKGYLKWEEID